MGKKNRKPKVVSWEEGIAEYDKQVKYARIKELRDRAERKAYLKERLEKHTKRTE